MMDATKIQSFNSFVRMMYAYSTPEIARHNGWLKIGDTEQGVDKRIPPPNLPEGRLHPFEYDIDTKPGQTLTLLAAE